MTTKSRHFVSVAYVWLVSQDVVVKKRGREGEVVDGDGMWECDAGWNEWRLMCWAHVCKGYACVSAG